MYEDACRTWELRDSARRCTTLAAAELSPRVAERLDAAAAEFQRQADTDDCGCGHCGDDEG